MDSTKVEILSAKHPRPENITYTYGTAGFRMKYVDLKLSSKSRSQLINDSTFGQITELVSDSYIIAQKRAELLDSVIFRVGLLAVLRSKAQNGKYIGVMITASHNAEPDNGVKLVEPLGEMLAQSWEAYGTELANATSVAGFIAAISTIKLKEGIDWSVPARVVVGRDTRPSGPALLESCKDGVEALDGELTDIGLVTTPQLHYVVRSLNTQGTKEEYGVPTVEGYYDKLATAFAKIVKGKSKPSPVTLDTANGIGAPAIKDFLKVLGPDVLDVKIVNDDTETRGKLNHDCGADFVKLYQKKPSGVEMVPGEKYASFDGDADRLVYYYTDAENKFHLLDGDKIATLAASFIMHLVREANLEITQPNGTKSPFHVGLVQTAYANGSSTAYVKETLKVPVVFTPTGVKHLHHEAEHFDVGVYFEANGHGTVLFSKAALAAFNSANGTTDAEKEAIETLKGLSEVINQAVGDALSDMLLVESVLAWRSWSPAQWDEAYTDLPSRQEKVKVANRHIFKPIKADTELAEPDGLQEKIFAAASQYPHGRAFVRPSGTEDIVRVYAEADTRENTDELAFTICGIIFDHYGGVGERPAKYL
ncbi:Phosphoacetylglucosamine Mutase [Nowakowskiella sp. JEL0407]|nr:Phosphoacetylglucosamine Mutase [Nowakowskiella sp. JEL0407]KAJ3130500.1 Phosphoacetylglucosamine Mutase [Nowakowskiella sp. JEL0407]